MEFGWDTPGTEGESTTGGRTSLTFPTYLPSCLKTLFLCPDMFDKKKKGEREGEGEE